MSDFSEAIASELDALWRFALRLTADESDAKDLVQRTCLRALENAHLYKQHGKLRSWLFKMEHRIWLNELRSRRIRQTSSFHGRSLTVSNDSALAQTPVDTVSPDTPESTLRLQQIFEMVELLPDAQRHVVLLVCVEGFTYTETADILDIPKGTVMSRLARARITLGKAFVVTDKDTRTTEMDGGVYS